MNLLSNYFRQVFSGYSKKIKTIKGKKIKFKHQSDADLFDPLAILEEHIAKFRIVNEGNMFSLDLPSPVCLNTMDRVRGKKPRTIAKIESNGGTLTVERFLFKEVNRTTSFYVFLWNEEFVGFWHKKYDYGREMEVVIHQELNVADPALIDQFEFDETPVKINFGSNKFLYVEKFVHTHLFYLGNVSLFNKVIDELMN